METKNLCSKLSLAKIENGINYSSDGKEYETKASSGRRKRLFSKDEVKEGSNRGKTRSEDEDGQ